MDKLYIDDIRKSPDEKEWVTARTIISAINYIENFSPSVISLDHDISHQVSVNSLIRPYPCKECFCAVAHFIGAHYKGKEKPKIILHTANPVGAEDMRAILERYSMGCETKLSVAINPLEMET